MTRLRWPLYAGIVVASLLLAFVVRDVARDVLITPAAYLLWELRTIYLAVPQLAKWFLLVLLLCVAVLWQLIPEMETSNRGRLPVQPAHGQVEILAGWIARARRGNYFKWQLANRLGRISRRLDELSGARSSDAAPANDVEAYLSAGINRSFVDFPNSRYPFQHNPPTALDLDPARVVDYLESHTEVASDRQAQSL
ncbi:MAG: hypothetical protein ACK2T0_04340 [Anaerolineales bacterium]|jgi:hypothetical protein